MFWLFGFGPVLVSMRRCGLVLCWQTRVVEKRRKKTRAPVCLVSCASNGDAIEQPRNIVFVFSFYPSKGDSLVFHIAVGDSRLYLKFRATGFPISILPVLHNTLDEVVFF
jgi:hypothetical protein